MQSHPRLKMSGGIGLLAAVAVLAPTAGAQVPLLATGTDNVRNIIISAAAGPKNFYLLNAPPLGTAAPLCDSINQGGWGRTKAPYPVSPSTPMGQGKVTFGGNVRSNSQGVPGGQAQYADHNDVDPFSFKSIIVTEVQCTALMDGLLGEGSRAVIKGQGRVTKLNAFDDLQENFTIELEDFGQPGAGRDSYMISLEGLFVYTSGKVILEGGNIEID